MARPLLPAYAFRRVEATPTWSHVEAEIALAVTAQEAGRLALAIRVAHDADPFGDHPEWRWSAELALTGALGDGPTPEAVRVTLDGGDGGVGGVRGLEALTFDPTAPLVERTWLGDDEPRPAPPADFWGPLMAWGWGLQAPAWRAPLGPGDLAARIGGTPPLFPLCERDATWAVTWRADRLRYHRRCASAERGIAFPIEPEARFEARPCEDAATGRRGVALVFCARDPSRVAAGLAEAPSPTGDPEALERWYRGRAGYRPEHLYGWLPAERAAEAPGWLAFLQGELDAHRAGAASTPDT